MIARQLFLTGCLVVFAIKVQATNSQIVDHVETQVQDTVERAQAWGLSKTEWADYREVMQERRGVWSPGLDPITALGVSAQTTAERDRFAELYVRTEFERTRKELAFQLAVDRAWKKHYPNTPRIQPASALRGAAGPTVRYALIVTHPCVECEALLAARLRTMVKDASEGVDIHVVGTKGDDQLLRRWVATQPAVIEALKAERVTINHGGEFGDLPRYPAVYGKTRGGQWARQL